MRTIIEAFLLVFTAELGDKSMLLAMTFATRFPLGQVLIGIFAGIVANHGLAVLIGAQAGRLLPTAIIHPLSGVLFLIFALSSLRTEEGEEEKEHRSRHIWLMCALTFFVGEFGDKTQITTLTLASSEPPLLVLAGTVTAMMCTSLLSIWVGTRIGKKIPERLMRMLSGLVFLGVGLQRLWGSLRLPVWAMLAFCALLLYGFLAWRLGQKEEPEVSVFRQRAEALKKQRELLETATQRMCLGQENCGTCAGAACMVGYAKRLFQINDLNELDADITGLLRKEYPKDTVREGLILILRYYDLYGWDTDPDSPQNRLLHVFETILFGQTVHAETTGAYLTEAERLDPSADWTHLRNTL